MHPVAEFIAEADVVIITDEKDHGVLIIPVHELKFVYQFKDSVVFVYRDGSAVKIKGGTVKYLSKVPRKLTLAKKGVFTGAKRSE